MKNNCSLACGCGEPWSVKFDFYSHDYLKGETLKKMSELLVAGVESAGIHTALSDCEVSCFIKNMACLADCQVATIDFTAPGLSDGSGLGHQPPTPEEAEQKCRSKCGKKLNKCLKKQSSFCKRK